MNGMHGNMDQNQEYESESRYDKRRDSKHDDLLHGLTASITLILYQPIAGYPNVHGEKVTRMRRFGYFRRARRARAG